MTICLAAGWRIPSILVRICSQLCADLADVHGTEHPNVHQTCSTIPMPVDLNTVTALGMAAAELVTNCYVHAFPDGKSGTIDVRLSTSESGEGVLAIKDNGIGFDVTAENKRHGVGLVKQLMQQVNGSFDIQSNDGTSWTLRFPMRRRVRCGVVGGGGEQFPYSFHSYLPTLIRGPSRVGPRLR